MTYFSDIEELTYEENKILKSILIKDKIVIKTSEQMNVYKRLLEILGNKA